jgi:transcriptional repressor NrdR
MRCPFCQFPDNRVLESRSAESGQSVRRRRECLRCTRRFTTYERIEFVPITVIKRNGDRESFDRSKLLKGIVRACEKTGIPYAQLEGLVDEIEAELQQQAVREVHSHEIGELVLQQLKKLNEVAYIRFASVYKQFKGISDFLEILHQLQVAPLQPDPTPEKTAPRVPEQSSLHEPEQHHESGNSWQTISSSMHH